MSRQQRFGLVALAIAVAVAAFFVLRPDDGDDEPAETRSPAATVDTQGERERPAETPTAETQPDAAPVRIRVEDGQPQGGVEEIRVSRGDRVRFDVTSDTPQEVHVHGYDLVEMAGPGSPARFDFDADVEGVFEVELEGPHTQIAELRVVP